MANKRLDPEQFATLQKLVVNGVYPDDIARYFNVAVSSIHNYKRQLKELGVNFPSIKGKKPINAPKPEDILKNETFTVPEKIVEVKSSENDNGFKFIIDGLRVNISSGAKSVNISEHVLEIKF